MNFLGITHLKDFKNGQTCLHTAFIPLSGRRQRFLDIMGVLVEEMN